MATFTRSDALQQAEFVDVSVGGVVVRTDIAEEREHTTAP